MRNPLSKRIVEIEPSGIRKFFDIVNEMEDAISLGVGEPDFDTPWHIRDEGIFSLEHIQCRFKRVKAGNCKIHISQMQYYL